MDEMQYPKVQLHLRSGITNTTPDMENIYNSDVPITNKQIHFYKQYCGYIVKRAQNHQNKISRIADKHKKRNRKSRENYKGKSRTKCYIFNDCMIKSITGQCKSFRL